MSLEWRSRAEREWVEEKGRKINEGEGRSVICFFTPGQWGGGGGGGEVGGGDGRRWRRGEERCGEGGGGEGGRGEKGEEGDWGSCVEDIW